MPTMDFQVIGKITDIELIAVELIAVERNRFAVVFQRVDVR